MSSCSGSDYDHLVQKHALLVKKVDMECHENGITSRRVISWSCSSGLHSLDPFLLLEHIGPTKYAPHEALGAVDHPHRGLQVLNYVVQGGILHGDSVRQQEIRLTAGSVQLVHCGRGLVHYEMPIDSLWEDGGVAEGFQLWVNTPHQKKMTECAFTEVEAEDVPLVRNESNTSTVRVLAGSYLNVEGAVQTDPLSLILDMEFKASSEIHHFLIPDTHAHALLYVWHCGRAEDGLSDGCEQMKERAEQVDCVELVAHVQDDSGRGDLVGLGGALQVRRAPVRLRVGYMATLSEVGEVLRVKVLHDCRVLLLAGVPTRETMVKMGPFAMQSCHEIEIALADFQNGVMGSIEGTEVREVQNKLALQRRQKKVTTDQSTHQ